MTPTQMWPEDVLFGPVQTIIVCHGRPERTRGLPTCLPALLDVSSAASLSTQDEPRRSGWGRYINHSVRRSNCEPVACGLYYIAPSVLPPSKEPFCIYIVSTRDIAEGEAPMFKMPAAPARRLRPTCVQQASAAPACQRKPHMSLWATDTDSETST